MEPPNTPDLSPTAHKESRDKRIGREISFGIQQTLACWATDFIDPYVGKWFQNKYGAQEHKVTNTHTWGGEIIGDSAAFFIYMGAKRIFTKPIDAITDTARKAFDPVYDRLGKYALREWAKDQQLDANDPRYKRKLQDYKEFQAENLVDSGIIATGSTLANVFTQRKLGNRQSLRIILTSKLIGATATVATMLGLRTAIPISMRTLDEELSDRYFSKAVRATGKALGIKEEHLTTPDPEDEFRSPPALVDMPRTDFSTAGIAEVALSKDKRFSLLRFLDKAVAHTARDITAEEQLAYKKQLAEAFIKVLNPDGLVAKALASSHLSYMQQHGNHEDDVSDDVMKERSMMSLQSIVLNRRDDMLALRKMLDTSPEFAESTPTKDNAPNALTTQKREALIESLLQNKTPAGREPAVHIYATARGHALEHLALAECFAPQGENAKLLATELHAQLPQLPKAELQLIAQDYMHDRWLAAHNVATALHPGGNVVREAIRRSEAIRLRHPIKNGEAVSVSFVERVDTPKEARYAISY